MWRGKSGVGSPKTAAGETRTEMLRESAWQSLPKTEHFIKVYVEQINQSSTNDYAMALDST
jgi:hypothetical protein